MRCSATSFSDTFGISTSAEDLAAFFANFTPDAWGRSSIDPRLRLPLAEADGAAIGFASSGRRSCPRRNAAAARIELASSTSLKAWHGARHRHALMNWVIDEPGSAARQELYLTVFIDNHRARRFYERSGFAPVGRYDFMVGSHADEDIDHAARSVNLEVIAPAPRRSAMAFSAMLAACRRVAFAA